MSKKKKIDASQYFTDRIYMVNLTNRERRYLALEDIKPEYETVVFYSSLDALKILQNRTTLFYRESTIVKVIHEEYWLHNDGNIYRKIYREYDTKLLTEERNRLMPLSGKGKPKSVTPTNVMKIAPFGCTLQLEFEDGNNYLAVWNERNHQELAYGEEERFGHVVTEDDFHAFMEYYISTCPENYFARIREIKTMEHQTVKYTAGDVVRCQVNRTHYVYGLILGKTRQLEKWEELPKEHSFRSLLAQPVLVCMYDFRTDNPAMRPAELSGQPMRPAEVCMDDLIHWGTHKIVGRKELTENDICFPFSLECKSDYEPNSLSFGAKNFFHSKTEVAGSRRLCVEWGFTRFELPWERVPGPLKQLLKEDVYHKKGTACGIRYDYCGKTLAEILKDAPHAEIRHDLLLPENSSRFALVMECLGLPGDCGYDDFVKKYGGLTRARYAELAKKRFK